MGMGPVHASKASRRGLRLDHLYNEREGPGGARERLELDMKEYWGALKVRGVTEKELKGKAIANSKVQPHVSRPAHLEPEAAPAHGLSE